VRVRPSCAPDRVVALSAAGVFTGTSWPRVSFSAGAHGPSLAISWTPRSRSLSRQLSASAHCADVGFYSP